MSARVLVVNADDFGLSAGTNAGIARAHEDGIVTSASLMVHGAAAEDAASYARHHLALSVGLHLDLGEWVYREGEWVTRYERGPAETEIPRQLDMFRSLVGADPTHIDSHQHVHRGEPVATLLSRVARDLGVPLRDRPPIRYCGDFYGQDGHGRPLPEGITSVALVAILRELPPGITELGCHPGDPVDLDDAYRWERGQEVLALCDPCVRDAIEEERIELRSFSTVGEVS